MGNKPSRKHSLLTRTPQTHPLPLEHHQKLLCNLHLKIKSIKELLNRFEPNVCASRDALKREAENLSAECSKLLLSNSWGPTQEEREAIASLMLHTSHLVEVLKQLPDCRTKLTPEMINELKSKIQAEVSEFDALIAAHEDECKKAPEGTTNSSHRIALLKKVGSIVRDVVTFIANNAQLEVSLVADIATGNVVGATVEGIELAASAYSEVVHHKSIAT